MDTFNVLIPGAGGPAGINTIKSLRLSLFKGNIVSTDSNPLSAGFFLSDFYYVIPQYDDKFFIEKLIKIIKEQNIKVLMPSSGFDIYGYSINHDLIVESGAIPIVSRRKVLEICRDKFLSYKFLSQNNLYSVALGCYSGPGYNTVFPCHQKFAGKTFLTP